MDTTTTHTADRLEGRGAMRTTWKRLTAVGLGLAVLGGVVTTTALGFTAKERAQSSQDLSVAGVLKPAQAITGISCSAGCDLYATTGTLNLPGGVSYTIWGYGTAKNAATIPGPTIVASKGDTLTIHLHNELSVATSLSVAAVLVADHGANLPVAASTTADYTFTVKSSGTLTYEPGPNVPTGNRQVALGLAGNIVVRPTTCAPVGLGCTYGTDLALPAAKAGLDIYDDEALVAINDFDSHMLSASDPMAFSMVDYAPDIHLINGKAFPDTDVIDAVAGQSVLLRYANDSAIDRTMGVLGAQQQILGRDAHPLTHAQVSVAPLLTPGQTAEAIVQVPTDAQPGDRFALADQSRRMARVATDGAVKETVGALTFINVWKVGGDPNQPVVKDLTLTAGTVSGTEDVSDGSADLAFSFTPYTAATFQRYFVDQIGGPVGADLGVASSGAVTMAQLGVTGNGPHVIWVQSSYDDLAWGEASGIAFFLDRSGPVVHDTNVDPITLNGDADHNQLTITSTGDTSLTGTQNVALANYAITPNTAVVNCASVEAGTALDADPPDPVPPSTQVQGFLSTKTIDTTTYPEGAYNVSVIAQDTLHHWSLNPANAPLCQTANSGLDAASNPFSFIVDTTGARVDHSVDATTNHADPATTNGYQGYQGNPNWEDSVLVEVQLQDVVSHQVRSNISRIEGFLEGSDGYTDTNGVNQPYTYTDETGGVFAPTGPGGVGNVDGSGFELIASDGAFDSPTEKAYALIPLSTIQQLQAGPHRVFVHALDDAGNWGPTHAYAGTALEVGATITLNPDAPTIMFTGGSRTPATGNRTQLTVSFMTIAAGTQTIKNIEWAPAVVGAPAPASGWTSLNGAATPAVASPFFANEIASLTATVGPTQTVWIRVTDSNSKQALVSVTPTLTLGTLRASQLNAGTRSATVSVSAGAITTQTVSRVEWAWTNGAAPAAWNNVGGGAANPRNVTITAAMPNTLNSTLPTTFWVRITDSLGTQLVASRVVPGVSITTLTSTNIVNTANRTVHAGVDGKAIANVASIAARVQVGIAVPNTFNIAAATITAAGPNRSATFNTNVSRTPRTFWVRVTDANGTESILGQSLPQS